MSLVAKRFGGKVKAAGGIRSFADAVTMIEAGAYPFVKVNYCPSPLRIDWVQVVVFQLWRIEMCLM